MRGVVLGMYFSLAVCGLTGAFLLKADPPNAKLDLTEILGAGCVLMCYASMLLVRPVQKFATKCRLGDRYAQLCRITGASRPHFVFVEDVQTYDITKPVVEDYGYLIVDMVAGALRIEGQLCSYVIRFDDLCDYRPIEHDRLGGIQLTYWIGDTVRLTIVVSGNSPFRLLCSLRRTSHNRMWNLLAPILDRNWQSAGPLVATDAVTRPVHVRTD